MIFFLEKHNLNWLKREIEKDKQTRQGTGRGEYEVSSK